MKKKMEKEEDGSRRRPKKKTGLGILGIMSAAQRSHRAKTRSSQDPIVAYPSVEVVPLHRPA